MNKVNKVNKANKSKKDKEDKEGKEGREGREGKEGKEGKKGKPKFTIRMLNLDGNGPKKCRVYSMPYKRIDVYYDYWPAVTNVLCPICKKGFVRWAEGGYVPGYRICDGCGKHFLAKGTEKSPTLIRVGTRKSKVR